MMPVVAMERVGRDLMAGFMADRQVGQVLGMTELLGSWGNGLAIYLNSCSCSY